MSLIIYLAGKMRGVPEFNRPKFKAVASALRGMGYTVLNPAEQFSGSVDLPWETYMRRDIQLVLISEAVVMLDGWEDSPGANVELTVARAIGIPVLNEDLVGLTATTIKQPVDCPVPPPLGTWEELDGAIEKVSK